MMLMMVVSTLMVMMMSVEVMVRTVDRSEDKDPGGDSIGDGGVDTNGSSDPDFWDDKAKVVCSDNIAGVDDNSKDDGGSNDGGGVDTNGNDCDWDDADTDGDNDDNIADGDKNDGDGNEAHGCSYGEGGGGNDEGDDNADGGGKDGGRDDFDDKDDIDFDIDDGVRGEFLQSNFVSIFIIFDANSCSIRCQ